MSVEEVRALVAGIRSKVIANSLPLIPTAPLDAVEAEMRQAGLHRAVVVLTSLICRTATFKDFDTAVEADLAVLLAEVCEECGEWLMCEGCGAEFSEEQPGPYAYCCPDCEHETEECVSCGHVI